MMRLARQVRFSVNPFLEQDDPGFNAYTSRPAGEGLAVFLQLDVEVVGPVRPDTGFVINVADIDTAARQYAVPVFAEQIRAYHRQGRHIDLGAAFGMLVAARKRLEGKFGDAQVARLTLRLNPFRNITMDTREPNVIYFSEKFEFAAMHKLWNEDFSPEQNFDVFGKCANPTGHGHNYIVEVTVKTPVGGDGFRIGRFQQVVDAELIALVDHKNLNADVAGFQKKIPTVENLATFAWTRLVGKFDSAALDCITVWESDRTYCTYHG
jgi:6-pyruvoyltetrahydropterin/6-carboxytetrahydropterin synthase